MKQALKRRLLMFVILTVVLISLAPFEAGLTNQPFLSYAYATAALAQIGVSLSQPIRTDFSGGSTIGLNPAHSVNQGFINGRHTLPLWERSSISKQTPVRMGFFLPIMTILFFFLFYQTSRTGSESDPDSHFGL